MRTSMYFGMLLKLEDSAKKSNKSMFYSIFYQFVRNLKLAGLYPVNIDKFIALLGIIIIFKKMTMLCLFVVVCCCFCCCSELRGRSKK